MNRFVPFIAVTSLAALSAPAAAWGPVGHRITAQIAQDNVSGNTRAHVREILGTEDMAEASTWPDEERSGPDEFWRRTAYPWHFVTLKADAHAEDLVHPEEGDAATALARFTAELRDPAIPREKKAGALRFIIHVIGDLHQPLHVGKEGDRGGNDVKVAWFDDPVPRNLHWVWDVGMIDQQVLSYTEYTDRLERRVTPAQVIEWWNRDPNAWLNESIAIRNKLYPAPSEQYGNGSVEAPFKLEYRYTYAWNDTMEQRLSQAGIRIAAYLDWVFAGQPAES